VFARLVDQYRSNPRDGNLLFAMMAVFLAVYFIPAGSARFDNAVLEAVRLTNWYAREHVVLCLLPAFVIAGAMAVYISQGSVMRHLGPRSPKLVAFGVASVSGTLLAVCSCTVLPLFGGIYKRGAGLGAAIAFLYSGPAINIMAIVVTAKVLGAEMGIARGTGAIAFSLVIGAIMHLLYRREEVARAATDVRGFASARPERPVMVVTALFALMTSILVFANWASADSALWMRVYAWKWWITAVLALMLGVLLALRWQWSIRQLLLLAATVAASAVLVPGVPQLPFSIGIGGLMLLCLAHEPDRDWAVQSWEFARQILPLLLIGVFAAGLALGRPGHEGLIPSAWISATVGGNGLVSNTIAAVAGAFMYFSTLTEVPIVEGLMGAGMGKGPALALLLAGPALSLPNMLVIRTILGTEKTIVYCVLVMVMATVSGYVYGTLF
jgi:hypothetical protein